MAKPKAEYDKLTVKFGERAKEYLENAKKSWQPEQEPVCDKDPFYCWSIRCHVGKVCKHTAPPRKPWVGLTDEEIKGILDCGRGGLVDIKKAEQILKERNT